jgi:uncharacterized protein YhfF
LPQVPPNEETVVALWKAYLASLGETPESTSRVFTAWHFCDNAKDADELVELVLAGVKRATAGSLAEYEASGDPTPHIGELSMILDGAGIARCIIQTTRVDIVPFDEITEEFAFTEGEGDKSLEYWRRVHWDYYTRVLGEAGLRADRKMPIAAERFEVVYSPELADTAASQRLNSDPGDST